MKKSKNSLFIKTILFFILFSFCKITIAQSVRGASACPDFSSASPKKNQPILKTFRFFHKAFVNSEGTIKITPYTNFGIASESVTSETQIANGTVVTTGDTSGWETKDFDKAVTGILLDYEKALKKKSSIQISIGYEKVNYAASYKDLQPSTDSKGIASEMNSGMKSNNFVLIAAYRYYFLYTLRRVYISPFLKYKTGLTHYKDLSESKDFNDFDFKENSYSYGAGLLVGYQFLIRKKIALDLFIGPTFNDSKTFNRAFLYDNVTQASLEQNRSIDKLMNIYDKGLGVRWGISIGYKFGKKGK